MLFSFQTVKFTNLNKNCLKIKFFFLMRCLITKLSSITSCNVTLFQLHTYLGFCADGKSCITFLPIVDLQRLIINAIFSSSKFMENWLSSDTKKHLLKLFYIIFSFFKSFIKTSISNLFKHFASQENLLLEGHSLLNSNETKH